MDEKVCTKCGELKLLSSFGRQKAGKNGYAAHCKECHKKLTKDWKARNKEKVAEYAARYDRLHKDKKEAKRERWRQRNPDKEASNKARRQRKRSAELREGYVASLLKRFSGFRKDEISIGIIETKRLAIELKRLSKQLKGAANESFKNGT